jgi:hypothetical protein
MAESGSAVARRHQRQGPKPVKQLLFIVILLLCCGLSGYFFYNIVLLDDDSGQYVENISGIDEKVIKEQQQVEATETLYTNVSRISSMAMQTATEAQLHARYPVAPTVTLLPQASFQNTNGTAPPPEPDPPTLTVLAIMITEEGRVAVVDIDGEENGKIVRQGTKFSDGDATITKIDAKGVTFRWKKKNIVVTM